MLVFATKVTRYKLNKENGIKTQSNILDLQCQNITKQLKTRNDFGGGMSRSKHRITIKQHRDSRTTTTRITTFEK